MARRIAEDELVRLAAVQFRSRLTRGNVDCSLRGWENKAGFELTGAGVGGHNSNYRDRIFLRAVFCVKKRTPLSGLFGGMVVIDDAVCVQPAEIPLYS